MTDEKSIAYTNALISLFKGVVNRQFQSKQWETILSQRSKIEDYISKIGLTLCLDEIDGYGYLKQSIYEDDEFDIPRLIPRHPLSYQVSLLLLLLRKQLQEFDSHNNDGRLIISKQDIFDKMHVYLKDTSNETKQLKEIETNIKKIENLGFIRRLKDSEEKYEVFRIIRSFIDGDWLSQLDKRLLEYQDYSLNEDTQGGDSDGSI